ncbi:MAG: FkbM family methyltransferase [Beijerinckiaceae bacterium]|nr:FkbM family methyltransferase [Beijerinckiaceae bacterium]
MSVSGDLKISTRILLNNALALCRRGGRKFVRLERHEGFFLLSAGGERLYMGPMRRWYRYKYGISRRLDLIASEYGRQVFYDISPGDIVVDIGANIGEFSLYAAGHGAKVYAIEADEEIFNILAANAENKEIVPVNAAIWKENGPVTFYSSVERADSSIIIPNEYAKKTIRQAITLDSFAETNHINSVALIKCDAEGAEPEVLLGAQKILQRTKTIALDCGPERQGSPTTEQCKGLLVECGFQILESHFGPRNILVATNPGFTRSN